MTMSLLRRLTVALAIVCWPVSASAQQRPSVDDLVGFFETVVFGSEHDPAMASKVIAKWAGSVRIDVKGKVNNEQVAIIQRHAQFVRKITGLSFEAVKKDAAPANLTFVFLPRDKMANLNLPQVSPELLQRLAAPGGCYFLSFKEPASQIKRGVIVVNNQRQMSGIEHCVLEEMLQTMGLPNDTSILRPSIFSDHDQLISPSRSDEIIIRTLYDGRVKPGMTIAQARPIVRAVIAEWDRNLP